MKSLSALLFFLLTFSCSDIGTPGGVSGKDSTSPAPAPSAPSSRERESGRNKRPDERKKSDFCSQQDFDGHSRAACKTSIVSARTESFASLAELWKTLPGDASMSRHEPKISDDENSQRVKEEKRNVLVKKAWLLAVKREDDGDFHLILASEPSIQAPVLFNAEISGLPEKDAASFAVLEKVRRDFETHFKGRTCFHNYKKFYESPVQISISGSLFYDVEHTPPGTTVGPKDLKTGTAWEIHPVTAISFQ